MISADDSTVTTNRAASVAIIDDEPMVLQSLGSFLRLESDYEVLTFESPRVALKALASQPLDVVISDFLMPGLNGLEFLAEIKKIHPATPRILLTGYADKENAIRAINEVGLYQYIEKPWDNEQLLLLLRNAIAHKGLNELLQEKIRELDRTLRQRDDLSSRESDMRRELDLAKRLQRSLLPEDLPQIAGLELATVYEPAMEIGGDFYDLVQLGEERWAVLLADATGHGIQAALSTALLKFAFANFAGSKEGPSQIMTGLNSILRRGLPEEVFVAALLVVVDGSRRRATAVNGGLPFPYLLSGQGQAPRPLACSGLLLGFAGDDLYQPGEEVAVDLAPGDRLLLYTDGVTEAADDAESFFEDVALATRLQQMQGKCCNELVIELAAAVHEFRAAEADLDDLTILGIENQVANGDR